LSRANRKERVKYQPQSAPNLIEIRQYLKKKTQVNLVPRNLSQESYIDMLKNPKKYIVFAIGPAGTGKTMLGVQMAIKKLQESEIKKIVITRPAVSVDEDLGFLPGTLNQKMEPWVIPILDVFKEYYHPKEIQDLMENGTLEIAPLGMMRGRTFKDTYIVADEMQGSTPSQMKMLLTRLGDGSRMIVTGDLKQADRPGENGLLDFCRVYEDNNEDCRTIAVAKFGVKDVERHPAVREVLRLYKEE
jgi:phosphate starvation-inducible PhoH-like protein